MALSRGSHLGPYEVLAPIGAGGRYNPRGAAPATLRIRRSGLRPISTQEI
jgi:hypothetical protein